MYVAHTQTNYYLLQNVFLIFEEGFSLTFRLLQGLSEPDKTTFVIYSKKTFYKLLFYVIKFLETPAYLVNQWVRI